MKNLGLTILAFVVLGAAPSPHKDKAKIDRDLLQGTWELVSVEVSGKVYSPEDINGGVFITKQGEVDCKVHNRNLSHYLYAEAISERIVFIDKKCRGEVKILGLEDSDESEYEINVSKNPKRLTFIGGDNDHEFPEPLYIYSVTKDELMLCFGVGVYPSSFNTKDNKKTCLILYRRAKKK